MGRNSGRFRTQMTRIPFMRKPAFQPIRHSSDYDKPSKVAVILSTYNQPAWLEKVLWGFACQSYPDFELIIADDGSDSQTFELIQQIILTTPLKITHIWQEDKGFRKSRILNQALLASSADYLIFTDQDCIPRRDFVETHVRYARKGFFLSGGYLKLPMSLSLELTRTAIEQQQAFQIGWLLSHGMKPTFKLSKLWKCPIWTYLMDSLTPAAATWNGCNASGWRSDLLDVNGFNEDMAYGGQDRELGERLINKGIKPIQLRYAAVCLHLDHKRPYKTSETLQKNKEILLETKKQHRIQTLHGIQNLELTHEQNE